MAAEPERKRQRLSSSETPLVMDVNTPAKWDFLAPWCEELRGQLVFPLNGYIRVLGPRSKREKPFRIHGEDPEEEEETIDPEKEEADIELALWRTREAIELLSLVATVDKKAFHMLMTQQCGLTLDDDESDEEEEELRLVEEEADFIISDSEDEENDEEENEEQDEDNTDAVNDELSDEHERDIDVYVNEWDAAEEEEDDEDDDVLVLPPDAMKVERRLEHENFVLPRFEFISLNWFLSDQEMPNTRIENWEMFCLAEYQPSEEYKKAKARILELQADAPRNQRLVEIPVSLDFSGWTDTAEELAECMTQLSTFMETVKHRNQTLEMISVEAHARSGYETAFVYRISTVSVLMSHRDNFTDLLAERALQVLGSGVPVGKLHVYLKDTSKDDADKVASRAALGKLFAGMLVHPPDAQRNVLPSFAQLTIDCANSAPWQFEALCSALSASRAPIGQMSLTDMCAKDGIRAQYWKLLARTFFHTRSCKRGPFSSVRGLDIPNAELTLDDLAEVSAVLQERDQQATIEQQWEICEKSWLLRENTPLQFTEKEGEGRIVVTGDPVGLPFDTLVELVGSNSDESNDESEANKLDVIVPGYGHCSVPRKSVVAVTTQKQEQPEGEPLRSLSLSFRADAEGVEGLIKHVGWSLRELSLSFHRDMDVNAVVPTILASCPSVTKLSLCESFIDLDLFSTVYESGSDDFPTILSLNFEDVYAIGDGDGKLFMKRLGDPTTRLGKHLRELAIYAEEYGEPLDHSTLSELWVAMGKNSTLERLDIFVSRTMLSAIWKGRLRQLDGQILPPRPLPSPSKLAFLSATRPQDDKNDDEPIPAIQQLDQRVLSLIFEFAATRVVRSVLVRG
ncbi:hypothetical protein PRNP1_006852 [Phytophthora ramorum]